MAEVQLYRIEFLKNNTFGGYVAGDVVDVYLEETEIVSAPSALSFTGTGVKPYLNGTPIGSGTFITTDPSIVAIQDFNAQICFTTSLVTPSLFTLWPFATYYTQANHWSCSVNAETCDLIMVGTPSVVPATSATAADGSITITASSSNTIEYNLGDDFVYGAGAATGVFSTLLPGNYRVFMRDAKNCAINILVNVGFSSDYGAKYRLEYQDLAGFDTRIDITRRGYTDAIGEICGADNPFEIQLRGEGETYKFMPVLSSQGNLNLTSETNSEFIELYTNDPNLYRVNYYKDIGAGLTLKWVGKVLPFTYSEEYKQSPYYTTVVATDGLPELKDFYYFNKDGVRFFGTVKLIKIIAYCLGQLQLGLNIHVACNMYSTGMVSTAADDPLDQAYVDVERFYIAEDSPSLEFVLSSILEPFGARITQWDGRWNIVRVEETTGSYDYRQFDADGDYVSNGTYNPVVDVDYPNTQGVMFAAFPNLELQPGYGRIRATYKLGLKPNILENGDFSLELKYINNTYIPVLNKNGWTLVSSDYPLFDNYEVIDGNNIVWSITNDGQLITSENAGNAYIQSRAYNMKMGTNNSLKLNLRYNIKRSTNAYLLPYGINFPYIKLRVRVKYGTLYLTQSGGWSTTDNTVDFLVTKLNEYIESEVTINPPNTGTPASGMDFDVRVYHATSYYTQFKTKAALEALITYDTGDFIVPTGYKTELRDVFTGSAITYDKIYYYELEETTEAESGYNIIEPTDYNLTNNPRKWVLKHVRGVVPGSFETFAFNLDRVDLDFLTDGKEPIDTILRIASGEPQNRMEYEREFIIGSSADIISTEGGYFNPNYSGFPQYLQDFINADQNITVQTSNVLSSEIIYTGWLRNSAGVAWDYWTRDGIAESDKLHGIWLRMMAAQYKKSWRLLRATLESRTQIMGLLNTFKEVNDSNRVYLPISVTLNDKNNSYSAELLEIGFGDDEVAGSNGSTTAPFTSAFTTGFGGGYN